MTPQAKMMYESFLVELLEDTSLDWVRWGKLSYAKEGNFMVIKAPGNITEEFKSEIDVLIDGQYRIMATLMYGVLVKLESCES